MKNRFLKLAFLGLLGFGGLVSAQDTKKQEDIEARREKARQEMAKLPKPYNPEDDAQEKINNLVERAKKEKKNIILQAGGNWCIWCLRFDNLVKTTPELKKLVDENYLYYHLNYSKENKNEVLFAKYGEPGKKFGYPVFIVLDSNGKQIHTQSSAEFEDKATRGYSMEQITKFFNKWVAKK